MLATCTCKSRQAQFQINALHANRSKGLQRTAQTFSELRFDDLKRFINYFLIWFLTYNNQPVVTECWACGNLRLAAPAHTGGGAGLSCLQKCTGRWNWQAKHILHTQGGGAVGSRGFSTLQSPFFIEKYIIKSTRLTRLFLLHGREATAADRELCCSPLLHIHIGHHSCVAHCWRKRHVFRHGIRLARVYLISVCVF